MFLIKVTLLGKVAGTWWQAERNVTNFSNPCFAIMIKAVSSQDCVLEIDMPLNISLTGSTSFFFGDFGVQNFLFFAVFFSILRYIALMAPGLLWPISQTGDNDEICKLYRGYISFWSSLWSSLNIFHLASWKPLMCTSPSQDNSRNAFDEIIFTPLHCLLHLCFVLLNESVIYKPVLVHIKWISILSFSKLKAIMCTSPSQVNSGNASEGQPISHLKRIPAFVLLTIDRKSVV